MQISVVGTGYVGLVVGACLAETGNNVWCADVDQKKIDGLKQNVIPIYEPGLDALVERNQKAGRLNFTTDVSDSIRRSEVVFIAVGTPPDEDGSADRKYRQPPVANGGKIKPGTLRRRRDRIGTAVPANAARPQADRSNGRRRGASRRRRSQSH